MDSPSEVHPPPPQSGGPGWGGRSAPPPPGGGWQPGPWAARPEAPKPGVIPLRPLAVGDMLDGAFTTLRIHWRVILTATFMIALVTETISVVIQGLFLDDTRLRSLRDDPNPSVREILHSASGSFTALGVTLLVTMIATVLATGTIALVAGRAVVGRPLKGRELWRDARPRLPQLIGLTVLIAVILCAVIALCALPGVLVALAGSADGGASLATLGLLGGSVISVWLWVQWTLAAPALSLEKQGIVAALKRSAKLVSGTWWRVLGVQLVGILLAFLISAVVEAPFGLIAAGVADDGGTSMFGSSGNPSWTYLIVNGVGQVLASALTLPISAGVTALLYMDQRIRRESLDVDLVRAAAAEPVSDKVA